MAVYLERTITVPGDADAVFAYVAEFSNTAEWDPGIVKSERVGDDDLGVGTKFDLVARFKGRDLDTTYEVTEYEPTRRIVLVGGTSNFTSTDEIIVTQRGESVDVQYNATFELSGVMRVAEPFLKGTFATLADKAVAGLKATLSS